MSDTTAFLSGCAIAGVATLIWLQGGTGLERPNFYRNSPQYNAPSLAEQPNGGTVYPAPTAWNIDAQIKKQIEEQQAANEKLQTELEQQQAVNESLQGELDEQKSENQKLIAQIQEQQKQFKLYPAKTQQQNRLQIGMLWALGGIIIILVVGGSIILIGIVALLLRPQKRYYPRHAPVIQPLSLPPQYFYSDPDRLMSPQTRTKRVREVEQDD